MARPVYLARDASQQDLLQDYNLTDDEFVSAERDHVKSENEENS